MSAELDPALSIGEILMRITAHDTLTVKGSELTNAEVDNNFIILYETIKGIYLGSKLNTYIGATTYPENYIVLENDIAYLSLQDGNIGNTPGISGSELFWGLASIGDVIDFSFGSERTFSLANFESMKTQGLLKTGSFYLVGGFNFEGNINTVLLVQATGYSAVSKFATRDTGDCEILEIDLTDPSSANWKVVRVKYSQEILDLYVSGAYDVTTRTLTIDSSLTHKEKIIISVLDYDAGTTYGLDELAKDPSSGLVFKSLSAGNTGNPLNGSSWDFADVDEDNVGRVLIEIITGVSEVHPTQFEVEGDIAVKFIATPWGVSPEPSTGEIVNDFNSNIILEGIGVLELEVASTGALRKTRGSLLN